MAENILAGVNSFLLGTYLYKYALDALQEGKPLKTVVITLACMAGYSILVNVFGCLATRYYKLKYPVIDAYVENILAKKAAEVDLKCFENPEFYDMYVKAIDSASPYGTMYSVTNIIWAVVNVVAVGTLIFTIDPIFLLLALLPFIYTLLIGKKRNRLYYEYNMKNKEVRRQRDYVRRTFYLQEFSKEMRLTEMWKVMFNRMHSSIAEMKAIVRKYGYKIMLLRYLFDFIFEVIVDTGTIILAAFRTLVSKTMLLGDCFVVINSIAGIASNIDYIGNTIMDLDQNSLYIDNLRSFLEYEVQIAEDSNAPDAPAFEKMEIRDVTFAYEEQDTPALSEVSFTVNAGERIAVVGHNGAGKTTLVKLLQRLYDPDKGEILLNGRNIKDYRLSSYRGKFGIVFQDYRLFAATVAENVLLRGDITDDDRKTVSDALKRAGAYEMVEALPDGVDSNVTKEFDSEGVIFSGGEAQKISIARLFAGKHEIVIMDEPTSALDPIAEQEMYRNMFEACEGKTVIFISHRLSSATMADRIYMFESGRIVEQGSHGELLSLNGGYAEMWHKQADSYADTEEVII
ncbi:MAG: ABC transporter ATP-binding protein [Clostridia bacterium]|nr:ABC transporter ATP-binding protein [Clostridia bacterium]